MNIDVRTGVNNTKCILRDFLWELFPSMARRFYGGVKQEFCIGIYKGDNPLQVADSSDIRNPILTHKDITDIVAGFVADPFMYYKDGMWYMFMEVLNLRRQLGEIGLATSLDGLNWRYERIVLVETFHLSYPYVFEANGQYFLLTEGKRGDGQILYRATNFPYDWQPAGQLLAAERIVDASIFKYQDTWWILADCGKSHASPALHLFFADDLLSSWTEHPMSPVSTNVHTSRPSGRVLLLDEGIIRFAQDVVPVYGKRVYAFRITTLTRNVYKEEQVDQDPILGPGSSDWNSGGMHHIDVHQVSSGWLACVDGFRS